MTWERLQNVSDQYCEFDPEDLKLKNIVSIDRKLDRTASNLAMAEKFLDKKTAPEKGIEERAVLSLKLESEIQIVRHSVTPK